VYLLQYGFSELMQKIFKCCNIQNIALTSHKEANVLIYGTAF